MSELITDSTTVLPLNKINTMHSSAGWTRSSPSCLLFVAEHTRTRRTRKHKRYEWRKPTLFSWSVDFFPNLFVLLLVSLMLLKFGTFVLDLNVNLCFALMRSFTNNSIWLNNKQHLFFFYFGRHFHSRNFPCTIIDGLSFSKSSAEQWRCRNQ